VIGACFLFGQASKPEAPSSKPRAVMRRGAFRSDAIVSGAYRLLTVISQPAYTRISDI